MQLAPATTIVLVVYRTDRLALDWLPLGVPVIVVHNDRSLDPDTMRAESVHHVIAEGNIGFGAGVNLALPLVETERVLLCNPDMELTATHWQAMADGDAEEIVTVPVQQPGGAPTSIVNRYPTPLALLLTGYRLGRTRLFRRGGRLRRVLSPLLGGWGREHRRSLGTTAGAWPLATHWVSGAVLSMHTSRLRAVGGFDASYFLYFEDVDLCARLSKCFPDMRVRMADVPPALHAVGGSATSPAQRRLADRHHLASVRRYAAAQRGAAWRFCALALLPRRVWLGTDRAVP